MSRAVRERLLDLAPLLTLRWVSGPLAGEKVPETGRQLQDYMADTGLLSVASVLSDGAGFNLLRYYDIGRDIMEVLPVGEGVECMKHAALVHHIRRILKANPCQLKPLLSAVTEINHGTLARGVSDLIGRPVSALIDAEQALRLLSASVDDRR